MRLNWFTLKLGRRVMWCLCEALGVTWWVSDWADGWDCVRERDLWRDSCLESGPGCQIRFGLLIDLQRSFTLHSEPHSLRTHLWLSDCQPPTDCLMPVIFYSGLRQWEYYPGPLFGYLHLPGLLYLMSSLSWDLVSTVYLLSHNLDATQHLNWRGRQTALTEGLTDIFLK